MDLGNVLEGLNGMEILAQSRSIYGIGAVAALIGGIYAAGKIIRRLSDKLNNSEKKGLTLEEIDERVVLGNIAALESGFGFTFGSSLIVIGQDGGSRYVPLTHINFYFDDKLGEIEEESMKWGRIKPDGLYIGAFEFEQRIDLEPRHCMINKLHTPLDSSKRSRENLERTVDSYNQIVAARIRDEINRPKEEDVQRNRAGEASQDILNAEAFYRIAGRY